MNTGTKFEQIKDVAIYLRKSRGEEEDLDKHREDLVELCNENGWRYVEFAEVGSSADIEYRPELKKLLKDIESGLFDGVVVIDKDRFSREGTGQALINKTLIENDCLIITPNRVYDLTNDSDMLMSEVEDLMARFEYRMIKKRLNRGKKRGSKRGEWTNGTPPYPYIYDEQRKGLIVDNEKRRWYRFMIENFLSGDTFQKISWELNKLGVKTNRSAMWHENSVRRLIMQETHLGYIISNKTEGSGHINKKTKDLKHKPREEWIIVKNCHEALKSQSEHEQIIAMLFKRRRVPISSKQVKLPLTSIVKCGKCGATMQVYYRGLVRGGKKLSVKPCQNKDPYGNKCGNSGGYASDLLNEIISEFKFLNEELKLSIRNNELKNNNSEYLELKINGIKKEIEKKNKSIERIDLAFEEGIYDLEKYKERLQKVKNEIRKFKDELGSYEIELKNMLNTDKKEKQLELEKIVNEIDTMSDKKLNETFKNNGVEIIWLREIKSNILNVEINFTK